LGDVRLVGRYTLLTQSQAPVSLAIALDLRAPTGNKQAFYSDAFLAKPSAIITRRFGKLRLDGEVGYIFRRQGQYAQLVVHDAIAYGVGLAYDLPKTGGLKNWRLIADASGQFPRGYSFTTDRYRAPLSVRGGLRAQIWKSLGFEVGAGSGLALGGSGSGYGREALRIFAGLRWDHTFSDRDGDGVEDDSDKCPDKPGLARLDGCPEGDRDGDGVPDSEDKCPDIPGLKELKGCPSGDQDGDGVPDKEDRCPAVPGPKDMEGCPDSDGDGVPDIDDKCPKEPGPVPNDGCPLGDEPVVEIETEKLSLRDAIQFDTAKDTLRPDSFKVLNEIVKVLSAHSELKKIRIEGHTDNVGGAAYNLDLSKRRARTVVLYLGSHGISPARLTSEGYGFTRPVASNATAFGRAKNRRVEFVIVDENAAKPADKPAAPPAKPAAAPSDPKAAPKK
jgi:outer membrane protein OmpA-like peptidoglycan-associated protein